MNACGCHDTTVFGHRCPAYAPRPAPKAVTGERPAVAAERLLDARLRWLARALVP